MPASTFRHIQHVVDGDREDVLPASVDNVEIVALLLRSAAVPKEIGETQDRVQRCAQFGAMFARNALLARLAARAGRGLPLTTAVRCSTTCSQMLLVMLAGSGKM